MSVLAVITRIKCDRCGLESAFQTEDEYAEYETKWHTDPIYDYCADCRIISDSPVVVVDKENDKFLMEIF